jgi:hypothetical protein
VIAKQTFGSFAVETLFSAAIFPEKEVNHRFALNASNGRICSVCAPSRIAQGRAGCKNIRRRAKTWRILVVE